MTYRRKVASVGQSVTDIPSTVAVEIHSGIDGWNEQQEGVWVNQAGGQSLHRYYQVIDTAAFDLSTCQQQQDADGNLVWICPDSAFTGVPVQPAPVTTTPSQAPAQTVTISPAQSSKPTQQQPVPQPAELSSGNSWLWLLLLLVLALTMNDEHA